MGTKSTLRSTIISTGREEVVLEAPARFAEKRLSLELRMWSRSFRSSFAAIISAAPAFGQRMIGIVPVHDSLVSREVNTAFSEHTHSDRHAEESTDYPVDVRIKIIIARLGAVHRPVCLLAHAKAEQAGLADDEV